MFASRKVVSIDQAESLVRQAQDGGLDVVMCHGCFDIVHPGHIRHLQHAAKQGDRLLVTITGDGMIDKGTGRPLIPQELRVENLAALDCVNWVTVNQEPVCTGLLARIRPDVYVKGREYEHNRDPRLQQEREVVERYGGRVVFTSGDVIFSSTALIAALEETADPFHSRVRQLIDQHEIDQTKINSIIDSFRGKRVLVVGDAIKDTYVMCDRPDIAGESPVMALRPIEYRSFDGGASIIARHLAAMGAHPVLITGLPRSPSTERLRQRLMVEGVDLRHIVIDRPIVEKQRFLVGTSKVMKLDLGEPVTLDAGRRADLIHQVAAEALRCEAAIVADYGQGLFTSTTLTELCHAVRKRVDLMVGDVSGRRSNLLAMRAMDVLCPSESEIRDALHDYDEGLSSVVWHLLDKTGSRSAVVTLGDDGLIAFDHRPASGLSPDDWSSRLTAEHVPAFASNTVDQLGCGDALLAATTLALLGGGSLELATILGSVAAAAQSRRLGNAVISAADLRHGIDRLQSARLTYSGGPTASMVV